ncbi:uncharacterized protein N7511_009543 [Penicillium nucicola]|uniref:uncharacterized protein n=1 Tax=Penicillium nucicola TaxID=1850975 RepID=UPI0025455B24|nr:uncharacterized protein N7511_009543 [Penicillium nucicola]KAJ5747847.1 hypothetical protein N7511_009543 [Penicillium nucicola]
MTPSTTYANRITEMIGYRRAGIKRSTTAWQRTTGNTGEASGTLSSTISMCYPLWRGCLHSWNMIHNDSDQRVDQCTFHHNKKTITQYTEQHRKNHNAAY